MDKKKDLLTDPKVLKVLCELYEKEATKRLVWVEKYKDIVEKCAQYPKEPKHHTIDDVQQFLMKEGIATVTRDFISSARNRFYTRPNDDEVKGITAKRQGYSIIDVGLGNPNDDPRLLREDNLSCDPIMRPVYAADKELLYDIEQGRQKYLKERIKLPPEVRYYFPECISWDYGWRQKENYIVRGPQFPIYSHMARMNTTRVGLTPDPSHYKPAESPFCFQ